MNKKIVVMSLASLISLVARAEPVAAKHNGVYRVSDKPRCVYADRIGAPCAGVEQITIEASAAQVLLKLKDRGGQRAQLLLDASAPARGITADIVPSIRGFTLTYKDGETLLEFELSK